MKSVSIITDSNSGITQAEATRMGIRVLPMPFLIDGETYYEDITLTQRDFYEMLKNDHDISTSQPAIPDVCNLWEAALKESESVVYIPMSSGLSGSCQTAMALAQDYDGKVQVVDNQRISVTMRRSVEDALALAAKGYTAVQIKEILERDKLESSIYITLSTLSYLKKGGRLSPAAAALGTALRLKPVLQILGARLDTFSIARTIRQGEEKMLAAIEADVKKRFGGMENVANLSFDLACTDNRESVLALVERVKERFGVTDVHIDPLSLSVSCHIGPGASAITVTRKTPEAQ